MPKTIAIDSSESGLQEFLRGIAPFCRLDDEEITHVTGLLSRRTYQAGEYVFSEKDVGRNLFIVEQGSLVLELSGRADKHYGRGEYFGEIALIDESIRSGSIRAEMPSTLLLLAGSDLVNQERIAARTALKIFRDLAKKVVGYLRSIEQTTTAELIAAGESEYVEFKSTLRFNLYSGKFDKGIEHAVMKTIGAFLNTDGGTLIIGVNDEGAVVGLESDDFPNEDRAMLHLTNLVKERISAQHMSFVHCSMEHIDGHQILRVDCRPATVPAYVRHNNNEYFFVRTGPSTSDLRISEVHNYIVQRFAKAPGTAAPA